MDLPYDLVIAIGGIISELTEAIDMPLVERILILNNLKKGGCWVVHDIPGGQKQHFCDAFDFGDI
jgi:hypothetical protein